MKTGLKVLMEYSMTLNRCSFVMIMTLNTAINHDKIRNIRDFYANKTWRQHDPSGFSSINFSVYR